MAIMQYGSYNFDPVPLLNINKQYQKSSDGTIIGSLFSITLEGDLVMVTGSGLVSIDQKQDSLRSAFNTQGQLFTVVCEGQTIISGYPRINSINFPRDSSNWVYRSPFTIDLELDEELSVSEDSGVMPPFISDANEGWSIEFGENSSAFAWELPNGSGADGIPYRLVLTHNVSAVGKLNYNSSGLVKPAWQQAQDYVVPKLGFNSDFVSLSGVFNLTNGDFSAYNHVRTNEIDVAGGGFSVTETWLVINPTGSGVAGNATEDFSVTTRKSIESDLTSITVEGTINGLETRTYGADPGDFVLNETKYVAASGYWNTIKNRLHGRAIIVSNGIANRSINTLPLSELIAHNPANGTISYTYEYDDRPSNQITGAISEVISINDENPADLIAQIVVLGRQAGPILSDLSTRTESVRELNMEVVIAPATGSIITDTANYLAQKPTTNANAIVNAIELNLSGAYSQVFRTQDTEQWISNQGRYTRTVRWNYSTC